MKPGALRYLLFAGLLAAMPSFAAELVIGVVTDGPLPRPVVSLERLQAEIDALSGGDFEVSMPAAKRLHGGWTRDGIDDAIRTLLDDPEVDIVFVNGLVSSHEAAQFNDLPKPVIACVVADVTLQNMPAVRRADQIVSGKKNFVYQARVQLDADDGSIEQTNLSEAIGLFHDATRFRHLAVLLDALTLEAMPHLAIAKTREMEQLLGVTGTIVSYNGSVEDAVEAIPADADAVLVGPLLRMDGERMRALADRLIDRQLPSFALLGRDELEYGLLLASSGREEDAVRFVRRMALNVQRIVLGDEPGSIDVRMAEPQRLAINMRTAAAIGFYPRYAVLSDAEQLYAGEVEAGEPLGLAEAMAEAVDANLSLRAAAMEPLLAGADARLARSSLFPQVGVGVGATRIDADRANPVIQPERSVDAELSAGQVVYSDRTLAALAVARHLEAASRHGYRSQVLDTLQEAADGYLAVLRAGALVKVRASNLEVTRANLELARLRESIGASGRGDVLRWESQLATDRQNLVDARSQQDVALTTFNRVLNRSANRRFAAREDEVTRIIALFEEERFRVLVDNTPVWERFQDYSVELALRQSPELAELDGYLVAQQRQVLASKRRFYLPEVSLNGSWGRNLDRGGAGSDLTGTGLDDTSWAVGLSASWPLFSGGALHAQLDRDRYSLRQLQRRRALLEEQIGTRTRVALHRASGTYPALEFSAEAADAADENLKLVTDAYRSGAVSVTELIDAQNAALAAGLRAVDARYAYLVDVVDILRATGDFALLIDPGSTEEWFQKVESYMREHGVEVRR